MQTRVNGETTCCIRFADVIALVRKSDKNVVILACRFSIECTTNVESKRKKNQNPRLIVTKTRKAPRMRPKMDYCSIVQVKQFKYSEHTVTDDGSDTRSKLGNHIAQWRQKKNVYTSEWKNLIKRLEKCLSNRKLLTVGVHYGRYARYVKYVVTYVHVLLSVDYWNSVKCS